MLWPPIALKYDSLSLGPEALRAERSRIGSRRPPQSTIRNPIILVASTVVNILGGGDKSVNFFKVQSCSSFFVWLIETKTSVARVQRVEEIYRSTILPHDLEL